MELFIPVIEGTTRSGRQSVQVARYIERVLQDTEGVSTRLIDPRDYDLSDVESDEHTEGAPAYSDIVQRASGFFIVTPEYNHGYPGSLKSLLDKEFESYKHKPVAMAGVSAGSFGGTRAVQMLVPVVRELGLVLFSKDVLVPRVQEAFDRDGRVVREALVNSVDTACRELVWLARLFRAARQEGRE